jgi:hypothetical protein
MRGIKLDDLPSKYREQVRRQITGEYNLANKVANMEQASGYALVGEEKAKGYNGQVIVRVLEKRHRLPDCEGASFKYVLDSIVSAGILKDDDRKIVTDIKRQTIKIPTSEQEQTIVDIYAIGET